MKKLILSIAFTFCGLSQLLAVPIVINNESAETAYQFKYDVNTYLGILKDGVACNQTIALYYNIPLSNPNLVLIDGTTVWTSPWNGTFGCISEYLGAGSCQPLPLDHKGQRVSFSNRFYDNNTTYPSGIYPPLLLTGIIATNLNTIQCHPNTYPNTIITNTGYEYDNPPNQLIRYQRFGNTIAILTYR